jgi:hypothetical protein
MAETIEGRGLPVDLRFLQGQTQSAFGAVLGATQLVAALSLPKNAARKMK